MPASSRDVTKEERALWRREMEGIEAVPRDDDAPAEPPPARPRPAGRPAGGGIDRRTEQKLRRGQIEPERRLDLHGYRLQEATEEVERFVVEAQEAGCRCVLVITGRKLGDAGPEGVLRAALPRIVQGPALRNRVLLNVHAHRKHGGDAAFYLYLRGRAGR